MRSLKAGPKARLLAGVLAALALLLVASVAFARPGGGSSYSGGGSRSSGGGGGGGGGGGDGGAIVELLVWLCIEHPAIGIPLTIVAIGYFIYKKRSQSSQKDWQAGVSAPMANRYSDAHSAAYIPPYEPPPSPKLERIRDFDPNFSRVVFEDFLYGLYAEVHRARGQGRLDRLSAYLSPNAMLELQQSTRGAVEHVVIGAMRFIEVSVNGSAGARVVAELESNYTEAGQGQYVVERWTLARKANAKSRTPAQVRHLGCPNCGAPQESLFSGSCKHCARIVNDGSFDWSVQGVSVMRRENRPPILTANVAEQGNDEPTRRDPGLPQAIARLRAKDPAFDVAQLNARVRLIFDQFQIGWSNRDLTRMRPFMSDALFTVQQYWVGAYVTQRLRNVTENARISNIELVKATSDAFYDAVTVRLWASSLDYTISDEGRVVSGSRSAPRAYTEYWTVIRGTNRKGPTRTELACSNCGGPLDVNMAGHCKFCNVKVTTGDFDWVLSRIEQDESYTG